MLAPLYFIKFPSVSFGMLPFVSCVCLLLFVLAFSRKGLPSGGIFRRRSVRGSPTEEPGFRSDRHFRISVTFVVNELLEDRDNAFFFYAGIAVFSCSKRCSKPCRVFLFFSLSQSIFSLFFFSNSSTTARLSFVSENRKKNEILENEHCRQQSYSFHFRNFQDFDNKKSKKAKMGEKGGNALV